MGYPGSGTNVYAYTLALLHYPMEVTGLRTDNGVVVTADVLLLDQCCHQHTLLGILSCDHQDTTSAGAIPEGRALVLGPVLPQRQAGASQRDLGRY